jgi:hypothetical protein
MTFVALSQRQGNANRRRSAKSRAPRVASLSPTPGRYAHSTQWLHTARAVGVFASRAIIPCKALLADNVPSYGCILCAAVAWQLLVEAAM